MADTLRVKNAKKKQAYDESPPWRDCLRCKHLLLGIVSPVCRKGGFRVKPAATCAMWESRGTENQRERTCMVCGCTQDRACPGGCSWVEWDLCSACVDKEAPERTGGQTIEENNDARQ